MFGDEKLDADSRISRLERLVRGLIDQSSSVTSTSSEEILIGQRTYVAAIESTSSLSYVKLTTTTDKVSVNIGSSGMALVSAKCAIAQAASLQAFMTVGISGATTISAATNGSTAGNEVFGIPGSASFAQTLSLVYLQENLNPGLNTFDMYYSTSASTATFGRRLISVIPL